MNTDPMRPIKLRHLPWNLRIVITGAIDFRVKLPYTLGSTRSIPRERARARSLRPRWTPWVSWIMAQTP